MFRTTISALTTILCVVMAICLTSVCCVQVEAQEYSNLLSDELREIMEHRRELQRSLRQLKQEQSRLEQELTFVDALLGLQKKLEELRRNAAAAEKAGDFKRADRLEEEAAGVEDSIELQRELWDVTERTHHIENLIERLTSLGEEFDTKSMVKRLDHIQRLVVGQRAVMAQMVVARSQELDSEKDLEEKLEGITDQVEEHEEFLELVTEAFDEWGEDHDTEAIELLKEARSFKGESEGSNLEKQREAREQKRMRDPRFLPVAVTKQSLAEFPAGGFRKVVVPLLEKFCIECHGNDSSAGDLNIEKLLTQNPLVVQRQKWINIIEQTKNRVMPPEEASSPDESQRAALVLTLYNAIYNYDYSQVQNPGFEPIRRLTHDEYDNSLSDLFGVRVDLAKSFPTDLIGKSGFENSANTLFLQPILMERYFGAADQLMDDLLPGVPSTERQKIASDQVFFKQAVDRSQESKIAEELLFRFASKAYRRPISAAEKIQLMQRYLDGIEKGLVHRDAIKAVIRTVLISPQFLLKSESVVDPSEPFRINDWELASRLSYFLWASMPDDELNGLAATGKLHHPKILRQQVGRMILDEKSKTLGSIFAAQWLGSQHLGTRVRLDPIDNPWCTDSLMSAMRGETALFVHDLIKKNESISRLIDADFTYLNAELAKHYRISGVRGDQMRRVQLKDSRRGGILGQGSLLAVTSFPYRTSPVVRGKWILETVLGTPPPPPPPNVSEFPEEIEENERLTIKQKLERHRSSPNCYACHSQMDPLGLALENYDWFGRYRERYQRGRIDNSGVLPSGERFNGLAGLKQVIVDKRSDDLLRQVSSRLLSYALGRQLEYFDEPALRRIVSQVRADGNRFQTLVHEVVNSYPFQYKQIQRPLKHQEELKK